jgi:hypothetical protein
MLGHESQPLATAELDYRRERLAAQYGRGRRQFHLKWPIGLVNPNRRRPRPLPTNRPAPHHASSIG